MELVSNNYLAGMYPRCHFGCIVAVLVQRTVTANKLLLLAMKSVKLEKQKQSERIAFRDKQGCQQLLFGDCKLSSVKHH